MVPFPKAGTEDTVRGLVSNGERWLTRAEYRTWLRELLDLAHRQWLAEQGVQPKEKPKP